MIKDFFVKKENIFILILGLVSVFFVTLGFLFLYFKDHAKGPRVIPNSVSQFEWADFRSDVINQKLSYPKHLIVAEHETPEGMGVNVVEFREQEFLSHLGNETHFSIYPSGLNIPFYYASMRTSQFTSTTDQTYDRTEYLTASGDVWAVRLVPVNRLKNWGQPGFIWIQSRIIDRSVSCVSESGQTIVSEICDPFVGEEVLYDGNVRDGFFEIGYEIVNRNSFK